MIRRLKNHELAKIAGGAEVVTHGLGFDAIMSDPRSREDALNLLSAIRSGDTPYANIGEFVQLRVAEMDNGGGGGGGGLPGGGGGGGGKPGPSK